MKIAVAAMGGDHAPQVVVEGAVQAAEEFPSYQIVVVGDERAVREDLERFGRVPKNISIVHAGSFISMDEKAAQSVRRKRDASVCVATDLVKEGQADAIVTAGHTGAAVAATTLKLRLLEGIQRPGIGIPFPSLDKPCFMIAVGANIETKPLHLYQYAAMGDVYMRYIVGRKSPTVGTLK